MMDYPFSKDKLPQGFSYPLKRSALYSALENANLSQIHVVYYWFRKDGDLLMQADFCGETEEKFAAGQSSVSLYSVSSSERKKTEVLLINEGLPRLCNWLKEAENAGNSWRGKNHRFFIQYANEKLYFNES